MLRHTQNSRQYEFKRTFFAIFLAFLSGLITAYAGAIFSIITADPGTQFVIVFVTIFFVLFGAFVLQKGLGFALAWISVIAATLIVITVAITPTAKSAGSLTLSSLALGGAITGVVYLATALSLSQSRLVSLTIAFLGVLLGSLLGITEPEVLSGLIGVVFLSTSVATLAMIISHRVQRGDPRYRLIQDFMFHLSIRGNVEIFLSYRRQDSADVNGRIYEYLTKEFGQGSIFRDLDSIPIGVDFREELNRAITRCQIFITIIGPQWLNIADANGKPRLQNPDDIVRVEIESALERNILVIPILVSGTTMPTAEALPESLTQLAYQNGRPVRPDPDFHGDMARIVDGLKQYLSK